MIAGSIEIQMAADLVRIKRDMDEAKRVVGDSMAHIERLAGLAKVALGAIGAGLSISAFTNMIKGAIDAAEALNDLSIQSGMTVERLSALQALGRTTSTSAEMISGATNKLAKNMAVANEESKGTGQAIKALGLDFDRFKGLHPDEQLLTLAKAMAQFEDGSGKSAIAMTLLGKEGARMLPFMKDLAAANELVATTTAEQAAMADQYNDALEMTRMRTEALQRQLAFALLPALIQIHDLTQEFVSLVKGYLIPSTDEASQKFDAIGLAVRAVAVPFEALIVLGANVSFVFTQMAKDIGASAAAFVAMQKWDFSGAKNILKERKADAAAARLELDAFEKKVLGAASSMLEMNKANVEANALAQVLGANLDGAAKGALNFSAGVEKSTKAQEAHNKMMDDAVKLFENARQAGFELQRSIEERIDMMQREIDVGRQLTEFEKLELDLQRKLATGQIAMTAAEQASARAKIAKAKAMAEDIRWMQETAAENIKASQAIDQQGVSLQQQLQALADSNAAIGLNGRALMEHAVAIDLNRASAIAARAALLQMIDPAEAQKLLEQAETLRAMAAARREGFTKTEVLETQRAWEQASRQIGDALTDSLLGAFDAGRDGMEQFGDDLVRMFKQMVLRPTIQAIMQPIAGALLSALGVAGGAGGGGAAGGGANWLSTLGGGASLYKSAGSWFGAGSGAAASGYVAGGAAAPMAEYAGLSSGAAAAGGSSFASAIPIIGWIIAGILASKGAYESGNSAAMLENGTAGDLGIGLWEKSQSNAFKSMGFSDKWAEILSGGPLTGRLFGQKASASGFGIGSVQGGDFIQGTQAPFEFGRNTLGGGADPFLQTLSRDIAAAVGTTASLFGGGLQSGMRVGALTDRDRDNQVSSLLGFFGADNKLISGVQTGSGAFGAGGPGVAAGKIDAADLEDWIAEQMPVIILEGLKQSDLDARFETYFSSVAAADLTSEKAQQMLATATAVQNLTRAFEPLGGLFAQFATISVDVFEQLAKGAGGFDALGQKIGSYYQNYYSEAERTAIATQTITDALADVGLAMPTTREGFRALVDGLDLTTEKDRIAFQALMSVSDAFAQLTDTTKATEEAAELARHEADVANKMADLQIELLRATGHEQEAVNLQREQELAALRELDPALAAVKQSIYAATDAAAAAAKWETIWSGLDSVISDFVSGDELAQFRAGRVQGRLAGAGINVSTDQIINATADQIRWLFNAVGVDGKQAILEVYDAVMELQQGLREAQIAELIDGIAGSADELLAAYREINPVADDLVTAWRKNKTEMQALQAALDDIDGTKALSAIDQLKATIGQRNGLQNVIDANNATADSLRLGQGTQQALEFAKQREAELQARFMATKDPAIAQAWTRAALDRIKVEGELRQKGLQPQYDREFQAAQELYDLQKQQHAAQIDALQAEIEAATKLKELAQTLPEFLGSLRAGNLSNLSYSGRLDAQRGLFESSLQTGIDPQGQLTAYLQQAQQMYGGATAQYSALFESALAQYEQAVAAGALGADDKISDAQRQIDAIEALAPELQKAIVDTSDEQIAVLDSINSVIGDSVADLNQSIADQRQLLVDQLAELKLQTQNQEREITQRGAGLAQLLRDTGTLVQQGENAQRDQDLNHVIGETA